MVKSNMDMSQAENFLKSQSKKQDTGISELQAKAFLKAWKNNREKIYETMLERTRYNKTLKDFSWSVTSPVASRYIQNNEAASASISLHLGNAKNSEVRKNVFRKLLIPVTRRICGFVLGGEFCAFEFGRPSADEPGVATAGDRKRDSNACQLFLKTVSFS